MSLKTFHLVFIATATALAFGLGAWAIWFQRTHGEPGYIFMGIGSLLAGAGLAAYGVWVRIKLKGRDDDETKKNL